MLDISKNEGKDCKNYRWIRKQFTVFTLQARHIIELKLPIFREIGTDLTDECGKIRVAKYISTTKIINPST